jgi:hypothetical protein
MAGQQGPDDIERLLRDMEALTGQADAALSGGDTRAPVPRTEPGAVTPAGSADAGGGLPARLVKPLVVSGIATGLVAVLFLVLAPLPFIGVLALDELVAVFLASLLVAGFYQLRG